MQLWGTGARAPGPCLIFQVTAEPYKLWYSTPCSFLSSKHRYKRREISSAVSEWRKLRNIFVSPLNYFLEVSFVPPRVKSWRCPRAKYCGCTCYFILS